MRGDDFVLTDVISKKPDPIEATLSYPELLDHLSAEAEVWINDGKIGARVTKKTGRHATLNVFSAREKGERLKPEKGVNFPGVEVNIPALTKEDIANLDFVAAHADIVGYSFVQTPQDVRGLAQELVERCTSRPVPALMLKIETPLAVRNLPRLIVQAGGLMPVAVMIARGDLAVEIGLERLSEMQEEILWLCEAAHVPVVWATQVLDSLVKDGTASRAETTDAAMGQRAECVMLNKGPHLVDAVAFLDRILAEEWIVINPRNLLNWVPFNPGRIPRHWLKRQCADNLKAFDVAISYCSRSRLGYRFRDYRGAGARNRCTCSHDRHDWLCCPVFLSPNQWFDTCTYQKYSRA